MSDIFPKWTNKLPLFVIAGGLLLGTTVVGGVWYYFTPKYTRVGYQPTQPVPFSHAVHVKQVGMDCRYCHDAVERSWYSNIPTASTCMNCHNQVLAEDPRLAVVRESAQTGEPVPWLQVHRTPDYVFFNHSVHVNRGVSCVECHGQVNEMDVVYHAKSFSMTFCLDCHRDPGARLRPLDKVTELDWTWSDDPDTAAQLQISKGRQFAHDWNVESMDNCSACHR